MAHLAGAMPGAPLPPLNVVVCGGGNGAQTAAAVLSLGGHAVSMLYSPVFADLAAQMTSALTANNALIARFAASSSSPALERRAGAPVVTIEAARVVPTADVIIVCVDGPSAAPTLWQLAPHVSSCQLLVMLPAMGAIAERQLERAVSEARAAAIAAAAAAFTTTAADDEEGGFNTKLTTTPPPPLPEMPMFIATKTLPWACRARTPGTVDVCGTKAAVDAVVGSRAGPILSALLPAALDALFPGTHFVRTGLLVERSCLPFDLIGNSILHPGMMFGTWADWDGTPLSERLPLYHGCSEACVRTVEAMQSEAITVISELCRQNGAPDPGAIKTLREDLAACYLPDCDPTSLGSLLRSCGAYRGITHPMRPAANGEGFVPDFSARLLAEDVPCGLCALIGAAEVLGIDTPTSRTVVEWAQARLGKEYLVNGRMRGRDVCETDAPQAYGASTPADLLLFPLTPAAAAPVAAAPAVPVPLPMPGVHMAEAGVVTPCSVVAPSVAIPAAVLQPAH